MNPRMMKNPRLRFMTAPIEDGGGSADPATEPAVTEPVADPANEGEQPPAEEKPKLSYEDLESALASARREAASTRTRLREAEDRLKEAKSPEEFAAALHDITEKNRELEQSIMRAEAARAHDLPEDLAALLQGDTKEALTAHAKALAKYATPAPGGGDPSGGLDPTNTDGDLESLSPAELAKRVNVRGR